MTVCPVLARLEKDEVHVTFQLIPELSAQPTLDRADGISAAALILVP